MPVRRIRPDDGWCEDPRDRHYNQPVRLKPDHPGDRLKRADHLYDLIVELDHNTRPRIAGRGSAVFMHIARPGFAPTAGCVALTAAALRRLVARASAAHPDRGRMNLFSLFANFVVSDRLTAQLMAAL